MEDEVRGTETKTETKEEEKKETKVEEKKNEVDVEKVKSDALSSLFKDLGVEDADSLKGIVTKAKEAEDANKTELQKKEDALLQTTKELSAVKNENMILKAKLSAVELGADLEMLDDLVAVAVSRATKDKDVNAVIAEIKDGVSGKHYFKQDKEEEEQKPEKKPYTRGRVKKETETKKEEIKETKHEGSIAERLLANRKERKGHYFK